ncbi:MAG: hypothetical protein HPY60_11140 [Candidatus Methanofastidiosum sp.]|nr:hypothetical protein [Methanofastidiosum sp.]
MNDKITELITKIISSTKERKIEWGRLSDLFSSNEVGNNLLRQYVLLNERGAYFYSKNNRIFSLNQFQSFYTEIEQGYVCVLKYVKPDSSYYVIALQSNKHSSVVELNKKDELQPELIELAFLIEGQVDNPMQYIDIILEKMK